MKNICFFINDITNTGGTERVSIMIANMLEDTGLFRVFFLSLHEHDSDTYYLKRLSMRSFSKKMFMGYQVFLAFVVAYAKHLKLIGLM